MGDEIELENAGDKVYFRGPATNARAQTTTSFHHFEIKTGKVAASGNVMSLMGNATELTFKYQLAKLFTDCSALTSAPELPALEVSESCYENMFQNCNGLISPPSTLPATAAAVKCYYAMFYGCSSLIEMPELPATTLREECYYNMFRNCTSLTTVHELPARTVETSCYERMFQGCSSLTASPHIKITTMNPTNTKAMNFMFYGCTSISSIKMDWTGNFSTSTTSSTANWVGGNVGSTGTFYYNGSSTARGTHAIPRGWTIVPF